MAGSGAGASRDDRICEYSAARTRYRKCFRVETVSPQALTERAGTRQISFA
jgi:hypothetical protein